MVASSVCCAQHAGDGQQPELANFAWQAGVSIDDKPAVRAGDWLSDSTGQT
ncbi:MAG: hypothetical protein JO057_20675 [Chloroflexi bacterium]|nr:hypothetical protein [Chloroflexota bacterium]